MERRKEKGDFVSLSILKNKNESKAKKAKAFDLATLRRQKDVQELYHYVFTNDLRKEAIYLIDLKLKEKKAQRQKYI